MALTNSSMPLMPVLRPSAVEDTAAAQELMGARMHTGAAGASKSKLYRSLPLTSRPKARVRQSLPSSARS